MSPSNYCLAIVQSCLTISEWKDVATIIATYIAIPGVAFAAFKTIQEIKKISEQKSSEIEQKERDQTLKRIEFTLTQHRRLFDDPLIYSVLCFLDDDNVKLREETMWDAKRKFLTFFEEIALLVNAGEIREDIAYYMFGYYAQRAIDGKNFKEGIDLSPAYWGQFFAFCEKAKEYLENLEKESNPPPLKF